MIYLFIALALIALLILGAGLAGLHFAFKKPEGALGWRWQAARALNWGSFLLAMTLWSGLARPAFNQFEREDFFTGSLACAALLCALIYALVAHALREGPAAHRASAALWLLCCVWMGNASVFERANRALGSAPYTALATAQIEELAPYGRSDRPRIIFQTPLRRGSETLRSAWLSPAAFAALQAAPERSTLALRVVNGPLGDPSIEGATVIPRSLSSSERAQCDRSWRPR